MKRKTLTLAISVFALLAIISVGFASWVITRPLQADPVAGSINVDPVTDLNVTISTQWVADAAGSSELTDAPIIRFGNKKDTPADYWLYNTSGEENLTAYLRVDVTFSDKEVLKNKKIVAHFKAVAAGDANVQNYTNAIQTGYISGPTHDTDINDTVFAITYDDLNSASGRKYSEILTINFNWGETIFSGKNPVDKWKDVSQANAAQTALNELYEKLNGISYEISFVQKAA
ncbi:MAG: hypothetical protein MR465_01165 [Bacilli bacterium]|nr:hypothetical protein [Bacilli bacterium]